MSKTANRNPMSDKTNNRHQARAILLNQQVVGLLASMQLATLEELNFKLAAYQFAPGSIANALEYLEERGVVVSHGNGQYQYGLTAIYLRLVPKQQALASEQDILTSFANDQAATLMQTLANQGLLAEGAYDLGLLRLLAITLVGFANSMYPKLEPEFLDAWQLREV